MPDAPKLDHRSAQQIFDEVEEALRQRLGVDARGADPMAEALLRVFARYCEVIIQRLNRVPEKTYLAFLDTLNLSRIPPQPARVPLTFSLVKQAAGGGDRHRSGSHEGGAARRRRATTLRWSSKRRASLR